jgi:hypothetical protein
LLASIKSTSGKTPPTFKHLYGVTDVFHSSCFYQWMAHGLQLVCCWPYFGLQQIN